MKKVAGGLTLLSLEEVFRKLSALQKDKDYTLHIIGPHAKKRASIVRKFIAKHAP